MFTRKDNGAWRPNPVLAAIDDYDAEVAKILRGIPKPVSSIGEMIKEGPFGRTVTYVHIQPFDENKPDCTGLLKTWTASGHRFADALDRAKIFNCP